MVSFKFTSFLVFLFLGIFLTLAEGRRTQHAAFPLEALDDSSSSDEEARDDEHKDIILPCLGQPTENLKAETIIQDISEGSGSISNDARDLWVKLISLTQALNEVKNGVQYITDHERVQYLFILVQLAKDSYTDNYCSLEDMERLVDIHFERSVRQAMSNYAINTTNKAHYILNTLGETDKFELFMQTIAEMTIIPQDEVLKEIANYIKSNSKTGRFEVAAENNAVQVAKYYDDTMSPLIDKIADLLAGRFAEQYRSETVKLVARIIKVLQQTVRIPNHPKKRIT